MTIRGVRDDEGDEVPLVGGHADGLLYPDDLTLQSESDLGEWRSEIAERVARRRPAGFAPWPVPDIGT